MAQSKSSQTKLAPVTHSRFAFKLALALGLPHPIYLDFLLTKSQMRDWIEYYNDEPFFADRIEAQIALFIQIIAQISGAKKVKAKDFMICKPKEPSFKEQKKNFESILKQMKKG